MSESANFEVNFHKTKHSRDLILDCFKVKPELTKEELREMTGLSCRTLFTVWVRNLIIEGKLIRVKTNRGNEVFRLVGD